MAEKEPLVGIIDSNQDLIELMEIWIGNIGFRTASENLIRIKDKPERYLRFLSRYDPRVLAIDVPIPYEENWNFIRGLMNLKESEGRGFVLTTTNKPRLERLVNATETLELVGKPFDLDELAKKIIETCQSFKGNRR